MHNISPTHCHSYHQAMMSRSLCRMVWLLKVLPQAVVDSHSLPAFQRGSSKCVIHLCKCNVDNRQLCFPAACKVHLRQVGFCRFGTLSVLSECLWFVVLCVHFRCGDRRDLNEIIKATWTYMMFDNHHACATWWTHAERHRHTHKISQKQQTTCTTGNDTERHFTAPTDEKVPAPMNCTDLEWKKAWGKVQKSANFRKGARKPLFESENVV